MRPFFRGPSKGPGKRPAFRHRRQGTIDAAAMVAVASATLVLFGAADGSALVQGDAAATLALQSSSTAVAPIGASGSATLVLLSSETASDPVQGTESATLVLLGSATASVLNNADASAQLVPSSSADGSVLDTAGGNALLSIATSGEIITTVITADGDALLSLQVSSNAHNDTPVLIVGGGSYYEGNRRPPATPEPELPVRIAQVNAGLKLLSASSASAIAQADGHAPLEMSVVATAIRGPDPMEALLFLIAA
ncbi:MAG: hypothetical protein M3Z54_14360 [Gemmatimonadota bacterium]|nr:hypothetical protein [Gemmatimonadota bacterium]